MTRKHDRASAPARRPSRRQVLQGAPAGMALLGGVTSCATLRAPGPPAQAPPPGAPPPIGTAATAPVTPPAPGAVPRRVLGRTGVEVSMLGIGGGSRFLAGKQPEAVIERALAAGIDYFDTAADYGRNRRSEEVYGAALAAHRAKIFLATKTADRTHDGAMREVEESLKRLRTDRLDLIQMHHAERKDDPTTWDRPDGALAALRKLKQQKVVRLVGFTGHDDALVHKRIIEMFDFDTVLMALSPAQHRPFRDIALPAAAAKGMGIIAMKVTRNLVGDGPGKASVRELLAHAWDLPVAVAIVGMESAAELDQNLALARDYRPGAVDTRRLAARLGREVPQHRLGWTHPGYRDAVA